MEYTPHGSLLDLMALKHVLTECEASNYFRQLISALEFCHSKFVAHRDLKLENLLIFWENRLKVGDFGFSRYFNANDPSTTFSRTFCGSDAYISPEVLHQKPYNPLLADIWACGVILFAMVIGRLPFEESGSIQKLVKVCFSCKFHNEAASQKLFYVHFRLLTKVWFSQTIQKLRTNAEI